jgi:hypothetical protein
MNPIPCSGLPAARSRHVRQPLAFIMLTGKPRSLGSDDRRFGVTENRTEPGMTLVQRLGVTGTLWEQLIAEPRVWADPAALSDTPALMRFAMDLRQALCAEGWTPRHPLRQRRGR